MDRSGVLRVVALLFAMFAVGWLAVLSQPPEVLASEMWPAGLGAAALFTAGRRYAGALAAAVLVLAFAAYALGGPRSPASPGTSSC